MAKRLRLLTALLILSLFFVMDTEAAPSTGTIEVAFILSEFNDQEYQPTTENLKAREGFQDARFGLFVHWGVYSVLGDGEWVMNNQNISIEEYEKLPKFFNPTKYDAEKWVLMAKNAGMKYITITSRHHDGFSMFDSKASDYNICLLYTSPSPRDGLLSRMPSSA